MNEMLDIADRINGIADELSGFSDILFFIYEKESISGSRESANAFITLSKMMERYSNELKDILNEI